MRRVALFGDSIIDNSIWISDPTKSITHQLRAKLPRHEIIDFTMDGLTLKDMTHHAARVTKYYFPVHRTISDLPAYNIICDYASIKGSLRDEGNFPLHGLKVLGSESGSL